MLKALMEPRRAYSIETGKTYLVPVDHPTKKRSIAGWLPVTILSVSESQVRPNHRLEVAYIPHEAVTFPKYPEHNWEKRAYHADPDAAPIFFEAPPEAQHTQKMTKTRPARQKI